jgi:hypothetical protein
VVLHDDALCGLEVIIGGIRPDAAVVHDPVVPFDPVWKQTSRRDRVALQVGRALCRDDQAGSREFRCGRRRVQQGLEIDNDRMPAAHDEVLHVPVGAVHRIEQRQHCPQLAVVLLDPMTLDRRSGGLGDVSVSVPKHQR